MTAKELRKKYLDFFKKKGHTIIPSASLVPEHDPTVLFTTAGMHPLVPYLLGEPHPSGKRLTNVQKSMRTDDIDDVGDSWHNTFFEMLGNWSLGDYWKKEAITWSVEFLTQELKLDPKRIYVTVFGGDHEIPGVSEDKESIEIWKSLEIPEKRIYKLGKKDNWWGPVGQTGPCGPDTEMFYDTGVPEHGKKCQPGETCGKYAEIWNDVFMEFNKTGDGKYEPLKQKNVDTGLGVERTSAILQGKDNVYDTDIFTPIMEEIKKISKRWDERSARIVADHLRAATFIIADGVTPSNVERGYILRRLIRRSIRHGKILGIEENFTTKIARSTIDIFQETYPELVEKKQKIADELYKEEEKFSKTLEKGLREFEKQKEINGKTAFYLYETFGFPIEMTAELAADKGMKVDRKEFEKKFEKHQEISRARGKKFAGGLADHTEITVRGHTATHLLHQALRDVLGDSVHQTGSNITPERIRFDFSYGVKLSNEQIRKVEDIVNSKIKENLSVKKELTSQVEADKAGAIGLFREKYGDKVSVYRIGDYSIEYCGGPHVEHTSKVGNFKIIKEEALGSGQRRIRAMLN
ncbi:MAG: alanine--tRNA ligase [Candidatus Woykebacteria bacterium RBG_16_43_9]|uniref:Alanine--tRNA ligase n=1 Tax=Candidatus Woykebacteria bacterium RBG_16_43_9 TaxID=1802596 RepID=A0A1G1WDW8_9BACT|nr:MAG: alanine--tRNA ligase [Candidatus Woykebacteria bacterium RBG_16_43_9]